MLGETVGSYRIERELGIGGMGAVYLAKHSILEKWAAVKVLRPNWSSDAEAIDRFFTEATATTAVRHGGIVDVYDFGHHSSGSAYLVMELLEGETLGERIRRLIRVPEKDVLSYGWQTARALSAAHGASIVHRDLKPDNIFLSDDPAAVGGVRVKLLDFGIAKLRVPGARSHTSPGELVGTPLFMSPEHCLGKDLDGRSDVYSLATVLFYAISGQPPFVSEDYAELLAAHVGEAPPHLSEVLTTARPEVSDLLFRCMRKNPSERPNAAEFAAALRELAVAPAEVTLPPAEAARSQKAPARATTTDSAPAGVARAAPRSPWLTLPRAAIGAGALIIVALALSILARRASEPGSMPEQASGDKADPGEKETPIVNEAARGEAPVETEAASASERPDAGPADARPATATAKVIEPRVERRGDTKVADAKAGSGAAIGSGAKSPTEGTTATGEPSGSGDGSGRKRGDLIIEYKKPGQ